jgi:hypothetical protein
LQAMLADMARKLEQSQQAQQAQLEQAARAQQAAAEQAAQAQQAAADEAKRAQQALERKLAERDAERAQREAERDRTAMLSKAEAALSDMPATHAHDKELLRQMQYVVAMKGEADPDQMLLSTAIARAAVVYAKDGDIDEANEILRAAMKHCKSIATEEQDDVYQKLKVSKRKQEAALNACTRCDRPGHDARDCYAHTAKGGRALGEPTAGRGPSKPRYASQMQAPLGAAAFFGPAPQEHPAYPAYPLPPPPPMHMQAQYGGGQQQYGGPPRPPGAGYGQPRACHICKSEAHLMSQCPQNPNRMGQQAQAPGMANQAPGRQVRETTARIRLRERGKEEEEWVDREQARPAAVEAKTDRMVDVRVDECESLRRKLVRPRAEDNTPSGSRSNAAGSSSARHPSKGMTDRDTQARPAGNTPQAEPSATPASIDFNADSQADWLDQGAWVATMAEEDEKPGCLFMYTAVLENRQKHTNQAAVEAPELRTSVTSEEAMLKLAEGARELGVGAVRKTFGPMGKDEQMKAAASLKAAILASFASRKKIVADAVAGGQECSRCYKHGHTAKSCPDQTQQRRNDETAADRWVRELIDKPRICVVTENRGLSLQEGVARWMERGEELNRGNPWTGSEKREDSLRRFLGYHKAMGMSSVHLGWIGYGVPLHFVEEQTPLALEFRNHRAAMEHEEFVDKEHADRVADGAFVEVKREQLRGVCPLQVVKHPTSGKLRLCQDLRWINGHLPNVQFRMESLHTELGEIVEQGDQLLTTDIAKAYYCLPMHPDAQSYLGWAWKGKYYMPTCLVFGLAPAPRIFTKIMRPMMAFFRSLGVRVLGMIDDYLWADKPDGILGLRDAVRLVLPQLGWSFNEKCEWTPADEALMLGMLVNAKEFEVRAPEKKVKATLADIKALLRKARGENLWPVLIKEVQQVTGRLMSMALAYQNVRVFTRSLYIDIARALEEDEGRMVRGERKSYRLTAGLSLGSVEELEFWEQRLRTHNGQTITSREMQVQVNVWSDASDVGWGGEAAGQEVGVRQAAADVPLPERPVEQMVYGELPRQEIGQSSTRRELVALLRVTSDPKILPLIKGKRIRVIMDSNPALRNLIKGGGPVPALCEAVKQWAQFCEQHQIQAVYEWVQRSGNWRADKASKLIQEQHSFRREEQEAQVREAMDAQPATQWRKRNNHWIYGKVAVFMPHFHQVDARVEMIRSQLEEAIILLPRWPAGATTDWHRRVRKHSIACLELGLASHWYKGSTASGHDDLLDAFWLMGRRGEKKREAWLRDQQSREETALIAM